MRQMVKADMVRHTRSVAEPAAFQRWNEAVDRFQAGHKFEPFIPGVSCLQPYGPTH